MSTSAATPATPNTPSPGVLVLLAIAGGAITGSVTFGGDFLTPVGSAVATGLGAVIAALLVYLASSPRATVAIAIAILSAVLAAVVYFWREQAPPGVAALVGGCDPFTVHAQNRYEPVGAAVRSEPLPTAKKVASFSPNALVPLDGWIRTQPAYPSNSPPFDKDVWFHLADDSGWVSFAGVRADPTPLDPTGLDPNGGRPAPLDDECSGTVRFRN